MKSALEQLNELRNKIKHGSKHQLIWNICIDEAIAILEKARDELRGKVKNDKAYMVFPKFGRQMLNDIDEIIGNKEGG